MKKTISNQGVKRPGSSKATGSGSKAKKRPPKQVEILDDVWLEALKHLTCPQWSKMRLVSPQLNGLIENNVSRLPLAVIDRAEIKYNERKRIEPKIIVSDSTISPDTKWFKNGGMTIDLPAGIQLDKAIIGIELKDDFCADLCVLGPVQKKKLNKYEKERPWFAGNVSRFSGREFMSEVLFYGEFRPHRNQSSLDSMAFFLKLLYDPSTYVKELYMYSLETKLKDLLFPGEEERYIRCDYFYNPHKKISEQFRDASVDEIREYVSWLEQNVQADYMYFPEVMEQSVNNSQTTERNNQICDVMTNFVFGATWINAKQYVSLCSINDHESSMYLFEALIQKFRNIATAQSIFPRISFSGLESTIKDAIDKLLSGKEDTEGDNVIRGCSARTIHTISNGSNRMRVHIIRRGGGAIVDLFSPLPYESK
ncbi:hypothetical protein Ddc_24348 [Ditylenchus destructor]|nr:hypothetical protein Ddc_24348 [Ditylenchus destructor]